MSIGFGRERQAEIYAEGVRGRKPAVPVDANRLEEAAREVLPDEAFAYLAGGAGLERTVAANREAFDRHRIVPRMLRDVSTRDASVELFGRTLHSPLLLAPVGVLELAHKDADLAVGRAAAAEGIPFVFSTQASVPMETVAAAMGDAPRWYQLYPSNAPDLAASLVARAEACGCEAIVLTLDTAMLAWRNRDLDLGYVPFVRGKGIAQYTSDPVFQRLMDETPEDGAPTGRPTLAALGALGQLARSYPGSTLANLRSPRPRLAVRTFLRLFPYPALTWDDLARLRSLTDLPLVLKGILDPEDARRAVAAGADGIVVSNHGGRQVDGAIATLDALPAVVDAVGGHVPVLLDSGVRSGADVLKAIALGARAVLIGRPYAYGLAIAGERGVREVIRNLRADLDLQMALSGVASLADVGPELLRRV